MLTGFDIISTLPFGLACLFGIVVLFLEVFQRPSFSRDYIAYVTAFGCAVTAVAATYVAKLEPQAVFGGMAALDGYGLLLAVAFSLGAGFTALVSPAYLRSHGVDRGEYYALLLFALAGMIAMASAVDMVVFFVGLEIQSVAAYALAAYLRGSARSAEAGTKYFILGAFASALLVYGVALLYGATGTTNLIGIGEALSSVLHADPALALSQGARDGLLAGAAGLGDTGPLALTNLNRMAVEIPMASVAMVLVIVAFCVKIAAVPFHMWAPDAYTGGPTSAVGFMASAIKAAGIAALVRVLVLAFGDAELRMGQFGWVQILFWIALASMVLGNLVALNQQNVKRMLAYSSVAHAGYLLVAVVAMGYGDGDTSRAAGTVFYAFAYTIGTVGAFGALAYLGKRGIEAETFDDLNGAGFKYPWLGAALSVFMLSSAGIPPTAGFVGKFLLFKAAIDASVTGQAIGAASPNLLVALVVAGILTSVAGVYYYLRVIVHLYMRKPVRAVAALHSPAARLAIVVCAAATLWFGLFPGSLTEKAESAVASMVRTR
ncbi:MAG: NADH-quinone oxidoreductase subunit N [Myxococcales bacterium]|nr:NADH-quinone oxidoreductase subunit N [Myxococcales bacterium]